MENRYWLKPRSMSRRAFLRTSVALTGAMTLGTVAAACGGGSSSKSSSSPPTSKSAAANPVDAIDLTGKRVELSFWHPQQAGSPPGDKLNAIIEAFNRSQQSVVVRPEYQGNYDQLFRKILAAVNAGQRPDLAVSYPSMVSEYQEANAVVALDEYVGSTKYGLSKAEEEDYVKPYWDESRYPEYGNKLLSFPFTKSLLVMFYNADMLKAANFSKDPRQWIWDDFAAAGKAVTKGDVKGWAIAVSASTFDGMVYSRGGKLISDDQKHWLFNQQPGQDTLSFYQTAVKAGWAYLESKKYADEADFGAARTAFTIDSSTGLSYYKKEVEAGGRFNWGVATIPHAGGVSPATALYGGSIAVFKTTPERQLAAWQFIKYFTSPEVTADWSVATGYLPVRKAALQSERVLGQIKSVPAYGVVLNEVAQYGRPEPSVRGVEDTRSYIEDAVTKVLLDPSANPKQVLDAAVQKGDQALRG